jgi:hypothetical protein
MFEEMGYGFKKRNDIYFNKFIEEKKEGGEKRIFYDKDGKVQDFTALAQAP